MSPNIVVVNRLFHQFWKKLFGIFCLVFFLVLFTLQFTMAVTPMAESRIGAPSPKCEPVSVGAVHLVAPPIHHAVHTVHLAVHRVHLVSGRSSEVPTKQDQHHRNRHAAGGRDKLAHVRQALLHSVTLCIPHAARGSKKVELASIFWETRERDQALRPPSLSFPDFQAC